MIGTKGIAKKIAKVANRKGIYHIYQRENDKQSQRAKFVSLYQRINLGRYFVKFGFRRKVAHK